jgi:hypothetical protein
MENILAIVNPKLKAKEYALDFLAIAFIYFIPSISHLFSFPVYLFEPMRIMLILCVAHSSKKNAYLIALTLPVFSFIISSHPSLLKTAIMTAELTLNMFLFFKLIDLIKNNFSAMLISILLSKIFYYLLKLALLSFGLMSGDLVTTPIYIQIILTLVFSGYIYFTFGNSDKRMGKSNPV